MPALYFHDLTNYLGTLQDDLNTNRLFAFCSAALPTPAFPGCLALTTGRRDFATFTDIHMVFHEPVFPDYSALPPGPCAGRRVFASFTDCCAASLALAFPGYLALAAAFRTGHRVFAALTDDDTPVHSIAFHDWFALTADSCNGCQDFWKARWGAAEATPAGGRRQFPRRGLRHPQHGLGHHACSAGFPRSDVVDAIDVSRQLGIIEQAGDPVHLLRRLDVLCGAPAAASGAAQEGF